ncbi:discoidin domain-containing protein [Streptomyces lunaelactis]|nr:discoidin domain-containing protein [Streptomyces lunaelactis]NUK41874.1 discoidin domain-containing protein [Streptomyces lunaelactis]NUK56907.1 discoidin domain-containing protein [Streptomyces lunaelactis]NUK92230.1 discoidin domain-containing protein [Streptomyces lunaelactis]NUL22963.1 discoidin domain-containing protein [Streptomyces lunaelactis]
MTPTSRLSRMSRLRGRGFVLLALTAATTALVPLVPSAAGHAAPAPHLHSPLGQAAPPGAHHHGAPPASALGPAAPIGDPESPAPVVDLARSGWTATAGDEETAAEKGRAHLALDGNPSTFWHSKWSNGPASLPHSITIDMHRTAVVSGLTYQPRPTDIPNGRIGAYSIATSTDGLTFGAPVATGTWKDDGFVKSATFARPETARFVRLTATSEAGGRGPWSSAAELHLSGPANPGAHGAWGRTISFPLVPVATAVLPNNKLLAWSAFATDGFGGSNGYTQTAIMDLTTGEITRRRVDNTGHDMFCPGTAVLKDGRVLVTGGSNDRRASIYDPVTNEWTSTTGMNIPRGYQAMTLLSNGDAFVLGGSWNGGIGGKDGEVWSAAGGTWRRLPGVPVKTTMTDDPAGPYRADNHQWLHAISGGRVLHLGPSKQLNWISTRGDGSITPAGTRADSTDAMNGNAVAYDIGKLLTLGGATAYEKAPATNRAYTVDLNGGKKPISARTGDMSHARAFSNSVVMPDGKVAVFGGQFTPVPFSDDRSVLTPEIWDPATGRFTPVASMAVPRNYHSVANLLPDGRIFTGGGGLCGGCTTNHPNGAIFTPPYLLNPDGTERTRPRLISTIPTRTAHGARLPVRTDTAIASFALVRAGAATHSTDNDQRRVPLTYRQTGTHAYELAIPTDPGVALPGTYMLFALDMRGVPSKAALLTLN